METVITVAVILAMIAVGVVVIRRLSTQHDARIAAYHYSDALPGVGRRPRRSRRRADGTADEATRDGDHGSNRPA
ncbi:MULTISPECIES: hypothetical protein [unclassified Streptomyces]|uniref:hypothetical protein n=1 Tax=unclassified Streptomyces TaxID=2593676 RepID=UPI000559F678|nr:MULTISPECIES: hypothetical protein [unclassified Streptomyces]